MSLLGGSLLGRARYVEAKPLMLGGYMGMKEREARIPAERKGRLTEAAEHIVRSTRRGGSRDRRTCGGRSSRSRGPTCRLTSLLFKTVSLGRRTNVLMLARI
jgi:hypothetical protein